MGLLTQEDPIGIAGGLNLYGFANGDPINFSDPFGLCPPEDDNLDDCEAGSSGWYAARIAKGEGSELLNTVGGVLASCGESVSCMTSMIPTGAVGNMVGRAAQAVKAANLGRAEAVVGSVLETQIAGRLFVGRNPVQMLDRVSGAFVGLRDAAATRFYRFATIKGPGHVNAGELVANLHTAVSNTHVIVRRFIPF